MEWIFSGIGTEIVGIIVSLIIGVISGCAIGYKIGIKQTIKQFQKAGDNSSQIQIGGTNDV